MKHNKMVDDDKFMLSYVLHAVFWSCSFKFRVDIYMNNIDIAIFKALSCMSSDEKFRSFSDVLKIKIEKWSEKSLIIHFILILNVPLNICIRNHVLSKYDTF